MRRQDTESGSGGQRLAAYSGQSGTAAPGADGHDHSESGQAPPKADPARAEADEAGVKAGEARAKAGQARAKTQPQGGCKLMASAAAGALAIGVGFCIGAFAKVVGSSNSAAASSAIPAPPRGNAMFVEGGQDNQTDVLASTAPGLVHIVSSGLIGRR
jgi:hypothetical protein